MKHNRYKVELPRWRIAVRPEVPVGKGAAEVGGDVVVWYTRRARGNKILSG